MGGGSVTSELQEEYGKDLQVEISKPALVQLKGVPYAARQSARYVLKGNPWERGWIYAFAEPFQIFIFYLVTGENVKADKDIIGQALSSFEYLGIR
jgi:hypothetical protein